MSTVTDFQDLAQKGQEQYLAAIRESQQAVVDAVGAWSQTVQGLTASVPSAPGVDQLPSAEAVIDNTFDLVEKLIAGQREFARNLLAAATPDQPTTRSASAAKKSS
jgi:hypothetical protein